MSYRIEFDKAHRVARVAFEGAVTADSFLAGTTAGREFIRVNGIQAVIVDFSQAQKFDFDAEFLRRYSRSTQAVLPAEARVLVAPTDAMFGLLRMFQVHRDPDGPPSNVVRSLAEACELLEMKSPDFRPIELT